MDYLLCVRCGVVAIILRFHGCACKLRRDRGSIPRIGDSFLVAIFFGLLTSARKFLVDQKGSSHNYFYSVNALIQMDPVPVNVCIDGDSIYNPPLALRSSYAFFCLSHAFFRPLSWLLGTSLPSFIFVGIPCSSHALYRSSFLNMS